MPPEPKNTRQFGTTVRVQLRTRRIDICSGSLPKTSKAPALHFTQRTATTDKGDRTDNTHRGEDLEQVPRCVVEEEDPLKCDQRSEEDGVRERGGFQCGRKVVNVGAEEEPLETICKQRRLHSNEINLPNQQEQE